MISGFSDHQAAVAARVLDEEEAQRSHLVVSLSGAHAYGFPSPDSDLDLKAIHLEATTRLLGLSPPRVAASRMELIDGVEIDYSSNEIGPVLVSILAGNGNYIERVTGAPSLRRTAEIDSLVPVVARSLSRRIHRHYRGFATSQREEFERGPATAKRVLYVLRTTLTGTHALLTGAVVTDLTLLCDDYGLADARALVETKRAGERVVLDEQARVYWQRKLDSAFAMLDDAAARSILPEAPTNSGEVEDWLVTLRRGRL